MLHSFHNPATHYSFEGYDIYDVLFIFIYREADYIYDSGQNVTVQNTMQTYTCEVHVPRIHVKHFQFFKGPKLRHSMAGS